MLAGVEVPIVIVGFGNAADIVKCLTAIATQRGCPKIGVFICENGGADAFDALIGAISKPGGPCAGDGEKLDLAGPDFVRGRRLRLAGAQVPITVAQARENLGFAGGVNAWIRRLLPETWLERRVDTQSRHLAAAGRVGGARRFRREAAQGHGLEPDHVSRPVRYRLLARPQVAQAHRIGDGRRYLRAGLASAGPGRRRATHRFADGGLDLRDEGLHRQDWAHG